MRDEMQDQLDSIKSHEDSKRRRFQRDISGPAFPGLGTFAAGLVGVAWFAGFLYVVAHFVIKYW